MIRSDFVSNSSSSSFVFAFKPDELEKIVNEKPKTILDLVIQHVYNYGGTNLPDPSDKRRSLNYYNYSEGKKDPSKYDWGCCPCFDISLYENEECIIYDLEQIEKYLDCCSKCVSRSDSNDCMYKDMLKIKKYLQKGKTVIKFRLDDCNYVPSHVLAEITEKDRRRILFYDEH